MVIGGSRGTMVSLNEVVLPEEAHRATLCAAARAVASSLLDMLQSQWKVTTGTLGRVSMRGHNFDL